ncbi:MAG: hypothetical protein AAFN16_09155, partial [Pseudomonadota bacterium]
MSKENGSADLENAAGAGVQALIDRLKSEGVSAGQSEGDEILSKAKARADEIVSEAQKRADALIADARTEAAKEKAATEDGLKVAARDLV